MASHRWMDLDGSWMYSTNPRGQPDNLLKYSTLPGRNHDHFRLVTDISRRPADDRGKYGTIPGRYLDKAQMRGQPPYRLWPATRLPQGSVLQDSTNWGSNLPQIHSGSTLGRMDQNTDRRSDARVKEHFNYKWDNNIASTFSAEYERKRQKLPGDPYGERTNYLPSGKQRQRGKLIQMDSIYGKWEADYILDKKMKELKYDEWEPLHNLPKALQNQLLAQTRKVEYPETEKIKLAMTNSGDNSQEKRGWWSKLVKPSKSGVTNPAISETYQDKADKMYLEQSSSNDKQEVLKKNHPQLRKRKVPPPYVPPPSYDYPHRIFPINKEKANHTKGFNQKPGTQILPLHDFEDCHESREKVPRYSVESTRAAKINLTSSTNIQENNVEAEEKNNVDPTLQRLIQGRKLPRAHSTWTGPNSDEFLDHIYESVEGRSSPLTHNTHNCPKTKAGLDLQTDNMIYGTVSYPIQRDASMPYTLYTSRKGIHDKNEATKRKNMTTANRQHQMPPFDVRPPIPLHGVKLPRELGFSYASGNFQNAENRMREEYINIKKQESEPEPDWRRPLRVVSSKESKTRGAPRSSTTKADYGRYSHTLPLKKQYTKPYIQEETKHGDSRKQRLPYQDKEFPRWREPGNANTLPGRSRDDGSWRSPDALKFSKRYNKSEHSNLHHSDIGRSQPKEILTDPALCNEGEGLFIIDASCVVVKAEYIFPPVMEQVKRVPNEKSKGGFLAAQSNSESLGKKERAPQSTSLSKHGSNSPLKPFSRKNHSDTQHCNQLSTDRQASTFKERAVRILGLSIGELDYLNEARDQHKHNRSMTEAVKVDQGHTFNEQEPVVLIQNGYYRKESKIRNDKEMACILEDVDLPPAMSVTCSAHLSSDSTEELKEKGSQQSIFIPDIHSTSTNENYAKPSNIMVQNDQILETPKLQESHLPTVDCHGISTYPSVVSHCKELTTTINQQTQENAETIASEQNCEILAEPLEKQVPENVKQDEDMLGKSVEQECLVKRETISMVTEKNTNEEKPITSMNTEEDRPTENQWKGKNYKSSKHAANFTNSYFCEKPDTQDRQANSYIVSDSQAEQTSSSGGVRKVYKYSRRPNYYAKDLREAVSRIRRHTAPDSDTDEDLEKPSSDLVEQVSGECVTSCSSDTSDSEVTVILCETEKDEDTLPITEDTDNERMNGHNEDGFTKDVEVAESSPATLHEVEIVDQSNVLQVPEQEAVYDLNSCIKEILQDLNKTEQEFFSSNEEQSK